MFKCPEVLRNVPAEVKVYGRRGDSDGGVFTTPGPHGFPLLMIASSGGGWEHVSVSLPVNRIPTWGEMCYVKDLFWEPEDVVVQFHPRRSEYVNRHPGVLHLWRQAGKNFPTPPPIFVG